MRTSRDRRLRHIVSYAADSVPYYRDLFRRERIDPREIRSAEDLKRLPLIDREVVRRDPRRFVSTSRRGRRSIMFLTSGSSGTPLPVFHDPYSLLANIAHGERERSVVARLCGKSLGYRELYILYRGSTTEHVWEFYRQHTFIPVRPKRLLLSILEPIDRVVDALNRFRPEVVISYGSYLDNLFRLLSARGIRPHPPRMLIYSGDAMTDDGKRLIEDGFGIPVHSIYNAVEAFKIGFSCEEGTGFHLHEDLCHVRVVTPSGRTADSGEPGGGGDLESGQQGQRAPELPPRRRRVDAGARLRVRPNPPAALGARGASRGHDIPPGRPLHPSEGRLDGLQADARRAEVPADPA